MPRVLGHPWSGRRNSGAMRKVSSSISHDNSVTNVCLIMRKTFTLFRKHPWSLSRRLLNWKSQRSKEIPWILRDERQKRDCFRLPSSVLTISPPESNPQTSSLLPLHSPPHLWVSLVPWLFESVMLLTMYLQPWPPSNPSIANPTDPSKPPNWCPRCTSNLAWPKPNS